jgi:ubiquinone/menaquinone biosynthesis C-methylase UbiE
LSHAFGEHGTVIAVDAEDAMIEYLSSRAKDLGPATIRPQKVGAKDPQLAEASVDAILILDAWHHIDGRLEYAKKLFRALRPGGRLVIVDSPPEAEIGPPPEMRVPAAQVMKELAAARFHAQVASETMPRHFLVVAKKE